MVTPKTDASQKVTSGTNAVNPESADSDAAVKAKTKRKPNVSNVNPKELEDHHKKIHDAAMEAQDAVRKALENMANQSDYEEKYEE